MKEQRDSGKEYAVKSGWARDKQSIVLGVGIALIAVLLAGNFLYNDTEDHARILRISGAVSIDRAGENIVPSVGTVLNARDKITTGEGSFVEVTYGDSLKDVLKVGSDSKVVLESAVIEKQTNIYLGQGEILLKLEKLDKGSTFKVRMPAAIAGVRGTSFGVSLRGKEAVISDFESRIFVKGLTRDFVEMKDELLLNDGWKARVVQFEKPSEVDRVTAEEWAAWRAWIKEIDSISPAEPPGSAGCEPVRGLAKFISARGTSLAQESAFMKKVTMNMASSIPFLAFLLYAALAANLGKVLL